MRRGWKFAVSLLLSLSLLFAGCAQQEDDDTPEAGISPKPARTFGSDTYMAELKSKGKIVIGVKFDVPQFGSLNPATSLPEGFDVDLGNIIAEAIGVKAEFVEAVSKNRIPFLNEDKVDLIISTMTINEERKTQIDFSNVYYIAEQRLLVAKNSKVKDVASLESQKANVCTAKGSTSEKNVRAIAPSAVVTLQDGYSQCFQLLQNEQTDAVTTDDVILVGLLKNDPKNFKLTGDAFSKEPYGMGIKKGRVGFVEFINEVLTDVKEDGTWEKLYDKWVKPLTGASEEPPPDTATAEGPTPKPSA